MDRGRFEALRIRLARLPRRPVIAAALSGVIAGVALGSMSGPIGAVLGMWLGVGVGLVTGYVLAHEDAHASVRTRELDAIIGITKGSMGAGPTITVAPSDEDDLPAYSSKEAWAAEWLTPPPPAVR